MIIPSINGQSTSPLPQRPFGALTGERDVFGRIRDVFSQIENITTREHVVQPRSSLGRCLFRSRCGQLAIYESVDAG